MGTLISIYNSVVNILKLYALFEECTNFQYTDHTEKHKHFHIPEQKQHLESIKISKVR
jgi:hypothetical protein